jgi:hypothetical protein
MNPKLVSTWLKDGKKRELVLDGWWKMIDAFRQDKKRSDKIEYQFLHRTASACWGTKGQAIVVYQIFYDKTTQSHLNCFKKHLKKWSQMITPDLTKLRFYTWEIEATLQVTNDIETQENPFLQMKNSQNIYIFGNDKIVPLL